MIDTIKNVCPSGCNCVFKDIIGSESSELLEKSKTIVNFYKGETIFKQGAFISHVGNIVSGFVKIYLEGTKNKQQILYISSPKDIIGQLSLFYSDSSIISISAITNCTVCLINADTIKYYIMSKPNIAHSIISIINKHNFVILKRVLSITQKQMHGRVADTLLYLSELLNNSMIIDIPLSRKELAEISGMTTESFIRILTEYKNDGIVALDGKKIELKSMNLLKKLSEIG